MLNLIYIFYTKTMSTDYCVDFEGILTIHLLFEKVHCSCDPTVTKSGYDRKEIPRTLGKIQNVCSPISPSDVEGFRTF